MRYDDEKYLDDEDDRDFWEDELELTSDTPQYGTTGETFRPYHDDSDGQTDYRHDEAVSDGTDANADDDSHQDYYSDREEETTAKPRRERFFGKGADEEKDEENDYYDSDTEETPRPAPRPKTPRLDPEDPDYWISEEESPFSGIIPTPTKTWRWKLAAAIGALILFLWAWIWFMRPYADSAVKYGYIKGMERRGYIIKTFEGSMIPYKELGDPDPLYFRELPFSVEGDSLAAAMKRMMLGCVPVRVEYKLYHAPLPWKGEAKMIIVKADTADPHKILPPEYRFNDK